MEAYPKIITGELEELARILRRIGELRANDIIAFDENNRLNSYQSGLRRSTVSTSSSYSVGSDDLAVSGIGGITFTLTAVPFDGQTHEFWKSNASGTLTIDGNGKNINGSATYSLTSHYAHVRMVYFGGLGIWLIQN